MKGEKRAIGQAPAAPGASSGAGSNPPAGAPPRAATPAAGAASAGNAGGASLPNRILGSLRDALNAASREDRSGEIVLGAHGATRATGGATGAGDPRPRRSASPEVSSGAAEPPHPPASARDSRTPARESRHVELESPASEMRSTAERAKGGGDGSAPKTQALRGRAKVVRNAFHQDPVVGWLVVVGGPGLGAFRPIYEGNNSVGRSGRQRIPIDFGDDTISAEEQAFIRYDSMDRSFLFVPNLSKTNIVAVNDKRPTGAVKLELMDVITMGRTQLAFVPFCGEEFDWSELSDLKE
jgi:hypothetical protein